MSGAPASPHWEKQDLPRWDREKRMLFDAAACAAVGLEPPGADAVLPDEWWRVSDSAGVLLGYGWLDSEWGDAQVSFFVDPGARGRGVGTFIVDSLEHEAGVRGLNYIYNVVPATHPDPAWMTQWLLLHGFARGAGDLRRQVRRR